MLTIFKYLKQEPASVIFVFALLLLQAFCDLALPQYTSDIVNVGISRYGIEGNVPSVVTAQSLRYAMLFMEEEQSAQVVSAYEPVQGYPVEAMKLSGIGEEKKERLSDFLSTSLAAVHMLRKSGQMPLEALYGMSPKERGAILQQAKDTLYGMGESAAGNVVSQMILEEKEILGIDRYEEQNAYMWKVGIRMTGMALLIMLCTIVVGYIASRTGARMGMRLRMEVFRGVVGFSHAEIDKFSTASLITRSTNDIQQVQTVVVMLLRMILYAPILAVGGVLKVLGTKTGLAWIIAVAVSAILLLVLILMSVAMPKFKQMQTLVDKVNLVAREILTGLSVIRAFSREKHEEERFDRANRELTATQLFTHRVMTFMMPLMMLIMNFVMVGVIWFGGKGVDAGRLQVGDMMAFMTYTMQIVMSFLMLTMISIMLPRAGVAANRIAEVVGTKSSIVDKETIQSPSGRGVVVFDNVDFAYPDASENMLEGISFTAEPGRTTAIIGSTGNGKSTLVNLIPRFYDVTGGKITIDGVDVRDMSQHELREMIGYVPQKAVLFSGTIRSNIAFGRPDAAREVVEKAARIAQAREFIDQKQETYDAPMAQGGSNVSGGQKQRLSIARAIAKEARIYIFDDSFSALDYKTEIALRQALKEETGEATVFIVAQRISTVLHAEQILVLDDGKLAGKGTHKELMRTCEVYRQIAESQLSAADIEAIEKEA